jgi:hypothetical protein
MNLFSRLGKPFVFASLTLTLVLSSAFLPLTVGVASSTSCPTMYSKEIRYYSDATYTNQVGTGMIYCNGRGTLSGTSTPYRQEDILDVCCSDPYGCVPC